MANESGHQPGRAFVGQDGVLNTYGSGGAVYSGAAGATAIAVTEGTAILSKGTAGSYTLAAPTATVDDHKCLRIMSITAAAHTVTQTTPGFQNGSTASDVATFGAAIGNSFTVVAYQGVWYVQDTPVGVTLG